SDKKVNPYDFEYAKFDPDSEVTGDKIIVPSIYISKPTIKNKNKVDEAFINAYGEGKFEEFNLQRYWGRIEYQYVAKMNYYYLQANNIVNNLEEMKKGQFRLIPDNEAVLHNIVDGGKKIYIGEKPNKKYVDNNTGKEVVIDSKGKIVRDFWNVGTFNRYTYISDDDPDKNKHFEDVIEWLTFGTGANDKSSMFDRIKIGVIGKIISDNYNDIKEWAKYKGYNAVGYYELIQYEVDRRKDNLMNQYHNLLKFNPKAIAPKIIDLR
ncbi:hypothetical protein, partial [Pseudoleptotrichia goodfellowii]